MAAASLPAKGKRLPSSMASLSRIRWRRHLQAQMLAPSFLLPAKCGHFRFENIFNVNLKFAVVQMPHRTSSLTTTENQWIPIQIGRGIRQTAFPLLPCVHTVHSQHNFFGAICRRCYLYQFSIMLALYIFSSSGFHNLFCTFTTIFVGIFILFNIR